MQIPKKDSALMYTASTTRGPFLQKLGVRPSIPDWLSCECCTYIRRTRKVEMNHSKKLDNFDFSIVEISIFFFHMDASIVKILSFFKKLEISNV